MLRLGPWACHCGPTLRPPGPARANPLHVFPVFGSSHFFDLFDGFPSCLASPLVKNGIQKLPFARRWLPVGPRMPTNDTRTTRRTTKRQRQRHNERRNDKTTKQRTTKTPKRQKQRNDERGNNETTPPFSQFFLWPSGRYFWESFGYTSRASTFGNICMQTRCNSDVNWMRNSCKPGKRQTQIHT